MRLIYADDLYKTIDQEADFYGGFGDNVITASELLRCIEMVPTIDAVPVVHSCWIELDKGFYVCENCRNFFTQHKEWSYCPNCGARMDGEKRETD